MFLLPESKLPTIAIKPHAGHLFGGFVFLSVVLGLHNSKAIALIFGLSIITIGILHLRQGREIAQFCWRPFAPILALAVWGAASFIWSINTAASRNLSISLPFTIIGGLILINLANSFRSEERQFVQKAIIVAAFVGIVCLAIEVFTGMLLLRIGYWLRGDEFINGPLRLFIVNNGAAIVSIFIWPAFIVLWNKGFKVLVILAALAMLLILSQSSSLASLVGFACGIGTVFMALAFRRFIHWILIAVLAVTIMGGPFIMKALPDGKMIGKQISGLSYAVYPRIVIWQYVSDKIIENPVFGYGLRTSRHLAPDDRLLYFYIGDDDKPLGATKAIPLHPHNGPLQLWLELGAVGAFLGLSILAVIISAINRLSVSLSIKSLCYGQLITAFVMASVTYGLWQGWWQGLFWLSAALTVVIMPEGRERSGGLSQPF